MNHQTYFNGKLILEFRSFLPLIVILVLSANLLQSQCPQDLIVTTQAEIDNFPIIYPNCTEIDGYVDIHEGGDIINLDGLSNITSIGGGLIIELCPLLKNVDGLSNLSYVGLSIRVDHCDILENLNGLANVTSYIGLNVMGCDSLINLNGLEGISSTVDFFYVSDCHALTDLTSFQSLNIIDGNISISSLPSLTNVSGLENLDSIAGIFWFGYNNSLTNVDGLVGLKSVGNEFQIHNNYSLENLNGLNNLQSIGWDLHINKCNSLTSLTGLDSLKLIGSDLLIDENNSLQTLTGIDNIEAASIMNLSITYNPQLTTCEVQSVCDYLANPNGDIQIYVNAQGCNNSVEVEEACESVGITESNTEPQISIFPNPFTTSTTIEYELKEISNVQITIYNVIGEVVYMGEDRMMPQGKHSFTWTADRLPEGMYYAVLRSEEGVSVVKMVKQ